MPKTSSLRRFRQKYVGGTSWQNWKLSEGIQWRDDCPPEVGRKVSAVVRRATNTAWRVFRLAEEHWVAGSSSAMGPSDIERCLTEEGSATERLDALAAAVYAFVDLIRITRNRGAGSSRGF